MRNFGSVKLYIKQDLKQANVKLEVCQELDKVKNTIKYRML